ncbi:SoxR reducing system RseC family protein [Oceaniserpentilla sp. 4NH20-0058]|uniref:SoxR reducing system RseC family protein n=1 Tax=Oceaniserpentilla sp. 4NH20-0058 TaxID=3127660 RepID=UPI003340DF85
MVEESARVTKIESDTVWVQAIAKSACGSCQAQKGCGHSLLAKVGQKQIDLPVLKNGFDVQVNDQVIIGVPEQAILRSSMLMYGIPLLAMIITAMGFSLAGIEEKVSVLGAFVALILGFVWVNRYASRLSFSQWHPKLIRKQASELAHIPMCEVNE